MTFSPAQPVVIAIILRVEGAGITGRAQSIAIPIFTGGLAGLWAEITGIPQAILVLICLIGVVQPGAVVFIFADAISIPIVASIPGAGITDIAQAIAIRIALQGIRAFRT